ncbi:MAG: glycosyl hydrolase family 28 protein, partial [Chitinivibrionales bacterium]|nr:glycosyl hydrolase family 28 protein [Chitinivibrionales bacterium]
RPANCKGSASCIYDIDGKKTIVNDNREIASRISQLPEGVYFLRTQIGNRAVGAKIVRVGNELNFGARFPLDGERLTPGKVSAALPDTLIFNKSGYLPLRIPVFWGATADLQVWMSPAPVVVTYSAPPAETLSRQYTVTVEGKNVAVYRAATQPAYDSTYSFAYFDFSGAVTVKVTSLKYPLSNLVVRSLAPISYAVQGNTVQLRLDKPCKFTLEPKGWKGMLHVFANPLEVNPPRKGDPGVIYFGPDSIYRPSGGIINVSSGQTLYIAGGAIVKAVISWNNYDENHVRIMGRGILDGSDYPHGGGPNWCMFGLNTGSNITIDGICVRGSYGWTIVPVQIDSLFVNNVKIVNSRVHNDDGIDVSNCTHAKITDCFVRTSDDCICAKGISGLFTPFEDMEVSNSILQADGSRGFLIGYESDVADDFKNIYIHDCLVQHFTAAPIVVTCAREKLMQQVTFERIAINAVRAEGEQVPSIKGMLAEIMPMDTFDINNNAGVPPGNIRDVLLKDISVQIDGDTKLAIGVKGHDAQHLTTGVTFDNFRINGTLLRLDQVDTNRYAPGLVVK